ncbi:hypothetical protein SD71_20305 [Cohnella kolymensis]|uniref:Tripartite ATP-independent periplasmic transporters DctQ component domain-containing protein n=1 Tax=Cohnella kolymensis TaxID=1590652 RepID=A0ABR5A0B7_9BACL|nr:TRAP transporter small permease [Cohnella kolymensis]KIL34372.1 hypothetical protein SD71_20305 [Cohnella kolymensis]
MLARIEKWFVGLNRLVIGILIIIMFLLVMGNVTARYFFESSFNWAEELASTIMIWITFLGIGLAMREGQIVAIETLYDYIPKRIAQYVRALVVLVVIAFMGFLVYLGFSYSKVTMSQLSASLRWPLGLIYMAVPIGSILFILHVIAIFRSMVNGSLVSSTLTYQDEIGGESRD